MGRERNEIINFIGPEGAGKTTMAKWLANELGLPYVGVGDVLRGLAENDGGRYGEACRKMFLEHTYLDPEMLLEIMLLRFLERDLDEGFILDGALRSVEEVEGFGRILKRSGLSLPLVVIYLRIPGWMSISRLVNRARGDDTVEGSLKRLGRFYHRLGQRRIAIEQNLKWEYVMIDAAGEKENVMQEIRELLENRNTRFK